jgi:AcrR family transcriptional regulator
MASSLEETVLASTHTSDPRAPVRREGAHVSEMQRRRLLHAMVEVAGEHGVQSASVGRVCERAHVSRRTFYDVFSDREACLVAAFEWEVALIGARVSVACAGAGDWAGRIRAGLTAILACFDEQPAAARLCVVETLRAGTRVLEVRGRVLDTLAGAVREGDGGAGAPPLIAESVVGGALSVIHARLVELPRAGVSSGARAGKSPTGESRAGESRALVACPGMGELVSPLMGMIVLPYLGASAAQRERAVRVRKRTLTADGGEQRESPDPLGGLSINLTYRTARVLDAIASTPGASNREVAEGAGVGDEGQMSKLLHRLRHHGLIENRYGYTKGGANAWTLTARGVAVHAALGGGEASRR